MNYIMQFLRSLTTYHRITYSSTPTGSSVSLLRGWGRKVAWARRQSTGQYLQSGLLTADCRCGRGSADCHWAPNCRVGQLDTSQEFSVPPRQSRRRPVPRKTLDYSPRPQRQCTAVCTSHTMGVSADAVHNRSPAASGLNPPREAPVGRW